MRGAFPPPARGAGKASRRRPLFFAALLGAALPAAGAPWGAVTSDLPPDPAVRWGTLPNGLRYAVLPNGEPKDHVSLRLLVAAGSLEENDNERGLAHFIEHMAFRGTKAYPRGALVPALEHEGIALGPDNTAFTNFNYTIYHLELPNAREPTVRLGLGVFRDYADGITFDPDLINLERGVILSEKATRDLPAGRFGEANRQFLWPEAREVRRLPIGTEQAVEDFVRPQFTSFYDAWYRPERMAVIVVGAVSADDTVRLITDIFGSLAARGPPRPEPADLLVAAASKPRVSLFHDPSWVGVTFILEHPVALPKLANTREMRVAALRKALAFAMLQRRLSKSAHQADGTYVSPVVTLDDSQPGWVRNAIAVSGAVDNWRAFAADVEQQHRRAFQYGFTPEELREAKAQAAAAYDYAVRASATRTSPDLAAGLAGVLLYGGTLATPAALREDIAGALEATTPADCLEAFREAWSTAAPHVFVGINSQVKLTQTDLAAVLNQSRKVAVAPPDEKAAPAFAYTDFGPVGTLRTSRHLDDLDVTLGEFENGVRVNFKPTKFEANNVDLAVRVGSGRTALPAARPGLDLFASAAFTSGGLHRHSVEELNAVMAGHNLAVTFSVTDDACVFSARCVPADLLLCLQLVTAYLTDAAYDSSLIRDVRASFTSLYTSLAQVPSGPIQAVAEFAMTGQSRFRLPQANDLFARDYGELAQWLEPQFKSGPIEVSVVGDTTWEQLSEAAGRTLGALPARTARAPAEPERIGFTRTRNGMTFITNPPVAQSTLAFYWPASEITDTRQERRCYLAAAVLGERIRLRLRDELGATYTPAAGFVRHEAFPGFNYFVVSADVAPGHSVQAARIVLEEIAALRTKGVDADTFARVRQTYLRARDDDLRSNGYWLYTVLGDVQQRPYRIDAARSRAADNAAISRADVNALLSRDFAAQNVFVFSSHPNVIQSDGLLVSVASAGTPATPEFDVGPQPLHRVSPIYPAALKAKGVDAVVMVEFEIDELGRVSRAHALGSADPQLARAAVEAVSHWTFVPAQKAGKPVRSHALLPMQFHVDKSMPK